MMLMLILIKGLDQMILMLRVQTRIMIMPLDNLRLLLHLMMMMMMVKKQMMLIPKTGTRVTAVTVIHPQDVPDQEGFSFVPKCWIHDGLASNVKNECLVLRRAVKTVSDVSLSLTRRKWNEVRKEWNFLVGRPVNEGKMCDDVPFLHMKHEYIEHNTSETATCMIIMKVWKLVEIDSLRSPPLCKSRCEEKRIERRRPSAKESISISSSLNHCVLHCDSLFSPLLTLSHTITSDSFLWTSIREKRLQNTGTSRWTESEKRTVVYRSEAIFAFLEWHHCRQHHHPHTYSLGTWFKKCLSIIYQFFNLRVIHRQEKRKSGSPLTSFLPPGFFFLLLVYGRRWVRRREI